MAGYRILFNRSAVDELEKIPRKEIGKVVGRIRGLEENPRPPGSQKLSAPERYRIQQGDYRIVYAVDDEKKVVQIFKIGHRSEIYRQ